MEKKIEINFPSPLQNALLDLLGGSDGPLDLGQPITNANTISSITNNSSNNTNDLLDLLGGIDLSSPVLSPGFIGGGSLAADTSNGNHIFGSLDTFGGGLMGNGGGGGGSLIASNISTIIPTTTTAAAVATGPPMTALDKNGVTVMLVSQKSSGCLQVMMTASNASGQPVDQFLFQAAVPKSFTLQMLSPSGSHLPVGGVITQEMRLTNSAKVTNSSLLNDAFL